MWLLSCDVLPYNMYPMCTRVFRKHVRDKAMRCERPKGVLDLRQLRAWAVREHRVRKHAEQSVLDLRQLRAWAVREHRVRQRQHAEQSVLDLRQLWSGTVREHRVRQRQHAEQSVLCVRGWKVFRRWRYVVHQLPCWAVL